MSRKFFRRVMIVAAGAALAGVLSAAAAGTPAATTFTNIHAQFESAPNFNGSPSCPASPPFGPVLVEGRGIGTASFGKFDTSIGTAAECSSGMFFGAPGYVPPNQDAPGESWSTCPNNAFLVRDLTATPPISGNYFDVHGTGTYMTKDGSVLDLVYHEHSESPFEADGSTIRTPPFTLHDCGFWQVNPTLSTGIFAGATGSGMITAVVPVRPDLSAPVTADYMGTVTLDPNATSPQVPAGVSCTGHMTGPITGNVNVPNGALCFLDAASVNGNVTVASGGNLEMDNSIASGNVVACSGCAPTSFGSLGSPFYGSTDFSNSTALGNLVVSGASGYSQILSSFVDQNLVFTGNTGPSLVTGDIVTGNLVCQGNTPAPVITAFFGAPLVNTAGRALGQCAPSP
jgi:hypothetical protein